MQCHLCDICVTFVWQIVTILPRKKGSELGGGCRRKAPVFNVFKVQLQDHHSCPFRCRCKLDLTQWLSTITAASPLLYVRWVRWENRPSRRRGAVSLRVANIQGSTTSHHWSWTCDGSYITGELIQRSAEWGEKHSPPDTLKTLTVCLVCWNPIGEARRHSLSHEAGKYRWPWVMKCLQGLGLKIRGILQWPLTDPELCVCETGLS